ncbi:hypothetical protein [Plantactinospora sp. KBS50]|uniref:hypothetical protein n=1 Tax=Plantactinospora sp. KBS50 TaxID=2024580 RepID=UPI000BAAAC2A|nr:hypothetical protein [Plantactinospora sp. KBS50]ASW53917.1 hypothetical protein CIK06_06575 [Plantactinospora sp. KBS50]
MMTASETAAASPPVADAGSPGSVPPAEPAAATGDVALVDGPAPVAAAPGTAGDPGGASGTAEGRIRAAWRWLPDLAAVLAYLGAAMVLTGRLWRDPTGRASGANPTDATLFHWMLAHSARVVSHLENPLLSDRMNQPEGINVMANTSILGLGLPLSPVTMIWGPAVSFLVVVVTALAGTAVAWYFVLSRHLTESRLAAFVGAALAGFCPGMISQAGGHPHIAVQFLVPLILAGVLRLGASTRPVRHGVILGLLIAYQVFLGEETLFITALVGAIVLVAWVIQRRREVGRRWRPFLIGTATAGLVAAVLVAYPLYVQFFGPGNYRHVPGIKNYGADLLSFVNYSPYSLGGDPEAPLRLARNTTELNTFYGWPLLIAVLTIAVWLRRHLWVRIATVVAVVLIPLSWGYDILIDGRYTGVAGPWAPLVEAPLFESVVTSRLGIMVGAAFGVLVTMALTELLRGDLRRPLRIALGLLLVGTMLPLIPRPLPISPAVRMPVSLADGRWRDYLSEDAALMPVPPQKPEVVRTMAWAANTGLGFKVSHSYVLGPDPVRGGGWAQFHTDPNATDTILNTVASTGQPATITDAERAQARVDLRNRHVGLLALTTTRGNAGALKTTVDDLLGQSGQRVGGMWLWKVDPN